MTLIQFIEAVERNELSVFQERNIYDLYQQRLKIYLEICIIEKEFYKDIIRFWSFAADHANHEFVNINVNKNLADAMLKWKVREILNTRKYLMHIFSEAT
jgi:hypothetical protein